MTEQSERIRTILLGIDGASFKLIQPLVDQGKLPNFANLLKRGAKGVLHSKPPTLGPAIWSTIVTGKLPGKHGIYDFFREENRSNKIVFNSSVDRKCKSLWSMVSERRTSVTVAELLLTHPPDKVDGHMVSSMIVPTPSMRAGRQGVTMTHPPELAAEIIKEIGGFKGVSQHWATRSKQGQIIEFALASLKYRMQLFHFLLRKKNEFNFFYFDEIDMLSHVCLPPRQPLPDDPLTEAYQLIDAFIGEVTTQCPTDLVIVSDHGFQPLRKTVSLNNFLASIGLLAYLPPTFGGRLKKAASVTPLRSLFQDKAKGFPLTIDEFLEGVDWHATKAYCLGTTAGTIYLNIRDRSEHGMISNHDTQSLIDFMSAKLKELRDPQTGGPVVREVFRKKDLCGENRLHAPDLCVLFHEGYCMKIRRDERFNPEQIINHAEQWSGCHDREGVFIAAGPSFGQGVDVEAANVEDITPTILYLLDLPLPADLDGKILREAFERGYTRSHPIEYDDLEEEEERASASAAGGERGERGEQAPFHIYNDEDMRLLAERLRIFGHLD